MANEFQHKDPGSELTQAEFIASDGTGHIFDGQAAGDILYASSTTVLARLAKATDGNVLELASGLPAWTASPTIGSTSWANANHAHAASNSGGTLTTLGTVTTGVWQGTAIASGYIAADAITGAKLADDAVDSEHYTDGSIDNAHLADDAVGIAELSATGTADATTFLRGDNTWAAAGGALQSTEIEGSRTASAGSGTQAITGAGFAPTAMFIIALDKVSTFISWGWGDDSAGEAMVEADAGSFTQTSGRLVTVHNSSAGNTMLAVLTSMDSDGCTITWTKYGSGLEVHFIIMFLR